MPMVNENKRYMVVLKNGRIIRNCYIFLDNGDTFRLRLSELGIRHYLPSEHTIILNVDIYEDNRLQDMGNDIRMSVTDIDFISYDDVLVFSSRMLL